MTNPTAEQPDHCPTCHSTVPGYSRPGILSDEVPFCPDEWHSVQTTLLSEEDVQVAQVDAGADTEAGDSAREGTCTFCSSAVDMASESTYSEILSWVKRNTKRDSATLRVYTQRHACEDCINKLRSGTHPNQPTLVELVESKPVTAEAPEVLFTDRSTRYKLGYIAAQSGAPAGPLAQRSDDYREGYKDGQTKLGVGRSDAYIIGFKHGRKGTHVGKLAEQYEDYADGCKDGCESNSDLDEELPF